MKRTEINKQREKPRRWEGRVSQSRIKKRLSAGPTSAEKAHMARLGGRGCVVCGRTAQLHHVTASIHGGRIMRTHQRVIPLCPFHHKIEWNAFGSVEALGHRGFWIMYGIDLLGEAERLWHKTEEMVGVKT